MKATTVQPKTYLDRPAFGGKQLRAAKARTAKSGLHWRIPHKAAALRFKDTTEARRARREFGASVGGATGKMLEDSAPRRKLTPTALKVAAEIARRERMQVCSEHRVVGGVGRIYVRASVSTLAAWCQCSRSAIEVALDRLEDGGEIVRIRHRLPHPSRDGRTVNDSNRYRITWWARDRWGLPTVDGLDQALLLLADSEPAPLPDPRDADQLAPVVFELTDQGIAEAVDFYIHEKWIALGRHYQRQGVEFEAFRCSEIDNLRSEPVKYLRTVLAQHRPRRSGGGSDCAPSRPPPDSS